MIGRLRWRGHHNGAGCEGRSRPEGRDDRAFGALVDWDPLLLIVLALACDRAVSGFQGQRRRDHHSYLHTSRQLSAVSIHQLGSAGDWRRAPCQPLDHQSGRAAVRPDHIEFSRAGFSRRCRGRSAIRVMRPGAMPRSWGPVAGRALRGAWAHRRGPITSGRGRLARPFAGVADGPRPLRRGRGHWGQTLIFDK